MTRSCRIASENYSYDPNTAFYTTLSVGLFVASPPPICFLTGTHILTPNGEIPIEKLAIGDIVTTHIGNKQIKWIGTMKPKMLNEKSYPIKICKSAFAENIPHRDLYVSPHHGIYLKNKLVLAKLLVNDKTIYQDKSIDNINYYHIELDKHSLLIAEGIKAESYLNGGSKYRFDNAEKNDNKKIKYWKKQRLSKYIITPEKAESYIVKITKRAHVLKRREKKLELINKQIILNHKNIQSIPLEY